MPELPEVETVRRGLEPVMAGQRIERVVVNRHDLRGGVPADFSLRLQDKIVDRLERRGKYMLLHVGDVHMVVWHLGMSGRVRVYDAGERYEAETHDHIVFEMENGCRIVFNDPRRFGMMYVLPQDAWEVAEPFASMGPEPLGNGFNGAALHEVLARRKGPIKTVLLNQAVVAGLGNIYVCEALYRARISPFRRGMDVSAAEAESLAGHMRDVLNDALDSGGSSLRDYRKADGGMGYFQHHFDVYGREGEACKICKTPVERSVQSGRSTFYCGACQR